MRTATANGHAAIHPREFLGALHQALRGVLVFDADALSLRPGARVALAVVVALVIGDVSGGRTSAAAMAAGALLAGIPSAVSPHRTSIRTILTTTIAMAVATFVGSASGSLGWVHSALLVPWTLLGGLLVGVGGDAGSIGTQAIAAMIVFGRFAESALGALELSGLVTLGGMIATLTLVLTRAPVSSDIQRRALSSAFASLAELAGAPTGTQNGVASGELLDEAERLLRKSIFVDDASAVLRAMLDVGRRVRLELLAIEGLRRRVARLAEATPAGLEQALGEAARTITAVSELLAGHRNVLSALPSLSLDTVDDEETNDTTSSAVTGHLDALSGQLRALTDLALTDHAPRAGSPLRPIRFGGPLRLHEAFDTLRSHASPRSAIGRHAVRLAFVVTIAEIIALHTPLQRGYWVALTAAVVLRPDFSTTFSRGLARMVGTAVGVVVGGLIAVAVATTTAGQVVAIGVFVMVACATFAASYSVFSVFLAATVVVLIGTVSPDTYANALARLLDTLIGGTLALVVYGLFPTWSKRQAPQAFALLARCQERYVDAVLEAFQNGQVDDAGRLRRLSSEARRAKADADDAVARAASEPSRRRVDLSLAQGVRAGLSRVSLAAHALRTDAEAKRLGRPLPEIAPFAEATDRALFLVAAALDRRAATGEEMLAMNADAGAVRLPPLRALQRKLAAGLPEEGAASLFVGTDELVDAIDTLGNLLGVPPTPETPPVNPASAGAP